MFRANLWSADCDFLQTTERWFRESSHWWKGHRTERQRKMDRRTDLSHATFHFILLAPWTKSQMPRNELILPIHVRDGGPLDGRTRMEARTRSCRTWGLEAGGRISTSSTQLPAIHCPSNQDLYNKFLFSLQMGFFFPFNPMESTKKKNPFHTTRQTPKSTNPTWSNPRLHKNFPLAALSRVISSHNPQSTVWY